MIRRATDRDVETMRLLVEDAYRHYIERIGKKPGPMLDDYEKRVAAAQVWLLEENGEIAGLVVLEERPDGLLLDNIAVRPTAQGRGFGRALITFAEQEAARRGHDEIRLYTHALMGENIAWYQRLGFREIGRVREKGFNRVYMAKRV